MCPPLADLGVLSIPPVGHRGTPLRVRGTAHREGSQSPAAAAPVCAAMFALPATGVSYLLQLLVMWPCVLSENDLVIDHLEPRSHERLTLPGSSEAICQLQAAHGRTSGSRLRIWVSSPHRDLDAGASMGVCLLLQLEVPVIYRR